VHLLLEESLHRLEARCRSAVDHVSENSCRFDIFVMAKCSQLLPEEHHSLKCSFRRAAPRFTPQEGASWILAGTC
jgi:hypothetical protein